MTPAKGSRNHTEHYIKIDFKFDTKGNRVLWCFSTDPKSINEFSMSMEKMTSNPQEAIFLAQTLWTKLCATSPFQHDPQVLFFNIKINKLTGTSANKIRLHWATFFGLVQSFFKKSFIKTNFSTSIEDTSASFLN